MVSDFTTKPELKVFFLNNTLKVAITARVVSCGFELWSDLEVLKEKLKVCTSVPPEDFILLMICTKCHQLTCLQLAMSTEHAIF